jgi:predicted PurR-regulated permease PerM
VLFFFYQIQSVLIYLVVSFILTLAKSHFRLLKKRLKFNHIVATIATLFIFILIIFGFIMMFVPLILSQGQNLSLLPLAEIERHTGQINQITVF